MFVLIDLYIDYGEFSKECPQARCAPVATASRHLQRILRLLRWLSGRVSVGRWCDCHDAYPVAGVAAQLR